MFRNFSPASLGVSGRQSELIELALTYGFRGFDIDMALLTRQVESRGAEYACRFIESAKIKVGAFELPVRWEGDEARYKTDLSRLAIIAKTAESVKAYGALTTVLPAGDERPYHENFEFHRARFLGIADVLKPHGVKLGLGFRATSALREGKQYQFINSAKDLITLAKTVGSDNVGVVVDLWNWHLGGGSPEQLRELSPQQIVMVRLADIPADIPREVMTEKQRLLPGVTGAIDFRAYLAVLEEIGYTGPITPYPHPSTMMGKTRDRIVQEAAESITPPEERVKFRFGAAVIVPDDSEDEIDIDISEVVATEEVESDAIDA